MSIDETKAWYGVGVYDNKVKKKQRNKPETKYVYKLEYIW